MNQSNTKQAIMKTNDFEMTIYFTVLILMATPGVILAVVMGSAYSIAPAAVVMGWLLYELASYLPQEIRGHREHSTGRV